MGQTFRVDFNDGAESRLKATETREFVSRSGEHTFNITRTSTYFQPAWARSLAWPSVCSRHSASFQAAEVFQVAPRHFKKKTN